MRAWRTRCARSRRCGRLRRCRREYAQAYGVALPTNLPPYSVGLLVGHAGMEDPVRTFQALWAGAALPPLMRSGVMESRLLLHHVLLHDDSGHAEGGYQRWGSCAVNVVVHADMDIYVTVLYTAYGHGKRVLFWCWIS